MKGSLLILPAAVALISARPLPDSQCKPVPVVIQTPTTPANSTYASDAEPPERFSAMPAGTIKIAFGQANIDAICGRPPCDKYFEGCTRGGTMALPDPFAVSDEQFARIVRHELAHLNGWPASHGD